MLFKLNSETLMISGTRGDSGTISFQFSRDMDGATVTFLVKKDITVDDVDAYITKMVTFPTTDEINAAGGGNPNNVVAIVLDPSDTANLPIDDEEHEPPKYVDYVWGLKVCKDSTYVETVVPVSGGTYPKFRLYYNINICSGSVPKATATFYATTLNVDTLTLQPAQIAGTPITVTMATENSGTNKQRLYVPLLWGAVTSISQYNTVFNIWQDISVSTFDISLETINNTVYRTYTHNGPTIASRKLIFNF
jgi:hypothetical protein